MLRFYFHGFCSFNRYCGFSGVRWVNRPHYSITWRGAVTTKSDSTVVETKKQYLVYQSPHRRLVLGAKTFSLLSSSVVLLLQPFIFLKIADPRVFCVSLFGGLIFSLSTPLLLHLLTCSHVTEIYYDKEKKTFTAYLKGLFLNTKKLEFTAEDVKYIEPTFTMASIMAKGVPLFISEEHFKDIEIYKQLVRFNEPLDVKKF
uniref:Hypotheticial protein n=1 Tax=Schistosoma japonicum TaxID=6182 RepID=C1L477_SCHJA|nr:hypotheticial protein [Schistosoma japonicum]